MLLASVSLMTSQVMSKSKCLTNWSIWICRAMEPYGIEISQYNDMDRVWTLLSVILSFMWAYLRSSSIKVTKSRKGQTKNFAFGRRDECFLGQISVKNVKNGTRTLLERPKSNKFQKSGKYRTRREQRENGCSRPSKHQNSVIFQDIYWKFCTQYTPDRVLSHVLPFVVWCLLKV